MTAPTLTAFAARRTRRALLVTLAAVPFTLRAQTQGERYPSKPMRMIVPFAPGGASDFVARVLQPRLAALLGQAVVIENKPGAAGNIGMEAAATAPPDGYTVFLGNVGTLAINPTIFGAKQRFTASAFVPVSLVSNVPDVLVTASSFPAKTVTELVEHAKKNAAQMSFASPGSGSLNRLEMELFRSLAGLDMVHVPYKGGAGPAVTDIVGGQVAMMFTTMPSALQLIKGGRLKALAVASAQRLPFLPDVPTMAEAGYPAVVGGSWQGLLFPAGTPADIVQTWLTAVLKVLAEDEVRGQLLQGGVEAVASQTPAEFSDFIQAEAKRWGALAKASNATAE